MKDVFNNSILHEDMNNMYKIHNNWNELKNQKIYVSGGAGMIASYLILFLIFLNENYNYNIIIYAGIRTIEKGNRIFGDYMNKPYFHRIEKDVILPLNEDLELDYIVHAASLASPLYYGKVPVETMLPNVVGTYELLEYARKHVIKSFCFFSSGSVYGSVQNTACVQEETVGQLDFLNLGNCYGESKRCGEALCKAYCSEYQVPVKMIRIHHTYGPTMDTENDKRVFSEFVNNISSFFCVSIIS